MNLRVTLITISALLLAGALLSLETAHAANSTATASVEIISPTEVAIVAAAELLESASTGVLTLSIPGAGAANFGSDTTKAALGMILTSTGVVGNTIIFSTNDSSPLATLIQAMAASGGTFGMNGILSTGQGVSLFITHAEHNDNGTGRVYAIVVYN